MTVTVNGIDYPDELGDAAKELYGITDGFLRGLMKAGVPGEMHTDLLGELYAEMPQELKRVMAFQIARREVRSIVEGKVATGELVRLEGNRVVEATLYDPEKHGPKAECRDINCGLADPSLVHVDH